MSETPDGYRIDVTSPSGEDTAVAAIDAYELLDRLPSLQAAVLGSAARSRSVGTGMELPAMEVGGTLFDSVFQSGIKALYLSSRQKAQEHGRRLRMVLRVRSPELAALPWELLYDEKLGGYLCLHHPVIRHVEMLEPVAPLRVEPPLSILGMVALPGSLSPLEAEAEREGLSTALKPLIDEGRVRLDWVAGGTKHDLFNALFSGCHIFHFIGHGKFDDQRREGMLVFSDEQGRESPLHAEALGSLISVADPSPRLVVLNSCETGTSHARDLFSSTAARLEYTVPAVVAMQFAVTDKAAVLFSRAFYQALAANRPVDEAVRTGRIALRADKDDSLECFTPVLYQRSGDARLFDFTSLRKPTRPQDVVDQINKEGHDGQTDEHPKTDQSAEPSHVSRPPTTHSADLTPRPEIDTGHWVVSMAVHPSGRLLATGSRKLVRVWDVITGQPTWQRRLGGWSTMVNALAFSPDGDRLASGSTDNLARVWDMTSEATPLKFTHRHFVNTVAHDRSGRLLATGSADATACLWDLGTGSRVLTLHHARAVKSLAFSPDGRRLLTGSEDRNAYVWDTETGRPEAQIEHQDFVLGVAYSPDGRKVATCSQDRTAQVSETETWTPLCRVEHKGGLRAVAFSPDSSMIATGSEDGAVGVWWADSGQSLLALKYNRSVNAVAFSPDGRFLVSAGEDKIVHTVRVPGTHP
ncbi:CHAT domain-containing protein [Streptomyces sp. NPDC005820]|uniref:CHAT domain-containing WD40 repeat protein n=1 Tax=Streptomyces sp. NPDC005820 TaxID=3157069 RepID=UPI0033C601CE